MANLLVQRANSAFKKGDYRSAKALYQEAANQYGSQLFAANVAVCEKALAKGRPKKINAALTPQPRLSNDAISQQLSDTQQLLEHYYNRCQELEYQLIDKC
ncbi:hypothetical protein [Vreelandella salicampi]|uniref:Tetratricopeptide repeat protein n=1 Tax=Vreelandella salicampi TaxID=1449798 RepID=A0A7Z0LK16_9GAMM|nr:hypothetical protein [Halomonas salicampi]NYS60328.1 hypothetical protein [Halomonas salicampi]